MKTFARTLLTAIAIGLPIAVGLFVVAYHQSNKEVDKTVNAEITSKKYTEKMKNPLKQGEDTIKTDINSIKTTTKVNYSTFVHHTPNFVP